MDDIKISLFASAIRVKDWERFLKSLKDNNIRYEVIFVGPNKPNFDLSKYPEFTYIYANVKPAQCYQIAASKSKGLLCGWTCDDATYSIPQKPSPQRNLDIAYNRYKELNNKKAIISMRPIEDGRDIWYQHRFFGKWNDTPMMAPMGLINRELFMEIGGYDRNFISAQAENDIIMRIYEIGGTVEMCMDAFVYIHHRECHIGGIAGEHKSMIRQHYVADRQVLENLWVVEGYGAYGPGGTRLRKYTISKTRLKPVESFEEREDWTKKSQGNIGEGLRMWD